MISIGIPASFDQISRCLQRASSGGRFWQGGGRIVYVKNLDNNQIAIETTSKYFSWLDKIRLNLQRYTSDKRQIELLIRSAIGQEPSVQIVFKQFLARIAPSSTPIEMFSGSETPVRENPAPVVPAPDRAPIDHASSAGVSLPKKKKKQVHFNEVVEVVDISLIRDRSPLSPARKEGNHFPSLSEPALVLE